MPTVDTHVENWETHSGESPENDFAEGLAMPLYIQVPGMSVGLHARRIQMRLKNELIAESLLNETSEICIIGNAQVSTPLIHELCRREIALCYFSTSGYFLGMTQGIGHKNIELRVRQYAVAADPAVSLMTARCLVDSKIRNSRTLLRRNARHDVADTVECMKRLARQAVRADNEASLRGYEGLAAREYFSAFSRMLDEKRGFTFETRTRRPPRDPVNAMLSFTYGLLVKDFTVAIAATGLDPYLGFYHRPHHGRASLALDLAEEFRPLLGDSVVIGMINNGEISPDDFERDGEACLLNATGRKVLLSAYERRVNQQITHPTLGYPISYRTVLRVRAQEVARWLTGEIVDFPVFRTR